MKIYFKKQKEGLFPLYDSDSENLDRIKNSAIFVKDFKKVRNPEFHALVFALLNVVFDFQDQFDDFESFRRRIKWYSGCYTEYVIDDKVIVELKSWEFGKMDEYEFRAVFSRIKDACLKHFCAGGDPDEIIRRVNLIIGFD